MAKTIAIAITKDKNPKNEDDSDITPTIKKYNVEIVHCAVYILITL